MKKVLSILGIIFILIILTASVSGNIFLYYKYRENKENFETKVSDLESQGSEKDNAITDLLETVKSAEIELRKDLNEDGKIGNIEIPDTGEDSIDSGDDLCRNASSDGEFIVIKPCTNEKLGSSFDIKGRGRVFEAVFSVRIKDNEGNILYDGNFMTEGGYKEELDAFEDNVTWTPPAVSGRGTIEFYNMSMMDGSDVVLVSFAVRY